MRNELIETARRAVKNWWVSLLIGILAIIVGIWCIATPDSTLVALSILFIVAFLVSGIFEIIFAVTNRDMEGWGWNLAGGILDLMLGILLMAMPLPITTLVLIYFVGFWILFRSIWGIGTATDLKRWGIKGWGWLLCLAILGVLFSFLFFVSPLFGGGMVVIFAGVAFLTYGIFRIYLAFLLKSFKDDIRGAAKVIRNINDDIPL